jgi:hypothetical protein
MIAGLDRPPQVRKRGSVGRALVAGEFLLLELPLLLPVIAGASMIALAMGVRGLTRRLRRAAD